MKKFSLTALGDYAQLAIKTAVIVICGIIAFGGHYPPVSAQTTQYVPVITAKDAVQDEKIDQVNQHLEKTDARVNKEWDAINANALAISGFQVEERIIGSVLGLLSSAGLFIQIRKKPSA